MQLYFKMSWRLLNTTVYIYCSTLMRQCQKINAEGAIPWHCYSDFTYVFSWAWKLLQGRGKDVHPSVHSQSP